MTYRKIFTLLFILFAFLMAGCGADEAEPTPEMAEEEATAVPATPEAETTNTPEADATNEDEPEAMPETVELDIKGFLFRPEVVNVAVGTAVEWTNLDNIQHSVTSGVPDNPSGTFDSGFFVQNEQFTYTFDEPGEYPFFCQRHPHMQAKIVVEE